MMLTVCFLLLWLYSLVSVKNCFPQSILRWLGRACWSTQTRFVKQCIHNIEFSRRNISTPIITKKHRLQQEKPAKVHGALQQPQFGRRLVLFKNKCKHGYSNMLRHDFPLSQRMLSGQSPIAGRKIHQKFRGAHFTMMIWLKRAPLKTLHMLEAPLIFFLRFCWTSSFLEKAPLKKKTH